MRKTKGESLHSHDNTPCSASRLVSFAPFAHSTAVTFTDAALIILSRCMIFVCAPRVIGTILLNRDIIKWIVEKHTLLAGRIMENNLRRAHDDVRLVSLLFRRRRLSQ